MHYLIKTFNDLYESEVNGEHIEDEKTIEHNKLFIEYLLESGLKKGDITEAILDMKPNKLCKMRIEDLSDSLWEGSILERNTFYYHKLLRLSPKIPGPGEKIKIYKEPKIKVTELDIVKYFYNKFNIREEWIDEKKDVGAVKHLLSHFEKFSFIKPVDFLLELIDYVEEAKNLFELKNYEIEFAELIEKDVANSKVLNKDKIIWRFDNE